jgi:hypothetical protein
LQEHQGSLEGPQGYTVLGRVERLKYNNCFDGKLEQATCLNDEPYERLQQRKYTREAVEEWDEARGKKEKVNKN